MRGEAKAAPREQPKADERARREALFLAAMILLDPDLPDKLGGRLARAVSEEVDYWITRPGRPREGVDGATFRPGALLRRADAMRAALATVERA